MASDVIKRLGRFELYDGPPDHGLPDSIMFFKESTTGKDFYALVKEVEDDQSWWLGVQDDGRIRIVCQDLDMMVPIDLTVYGYIGDKTFGQLQDFQFDAAQKSIKAKSGAYKDIPAHPEPRRHAPKPPKAQRVTPGVKVKDPKP